MQQRAARYLSYILYAAAAVGGVFLAARFLLPWTAPFLVAYAFAALLEPGVRFLVRHRWRRAAASGLLTLTALGLIVWAVASLSAWGISAVSDFAKRTPELISAVTFTLSRLEQRAFAYISAAPEELAAYLKTALDAVIGTLKTLPATLSQWVLDLVARAAQNSPDTLLFVVTAGIGTYFFSSSFPRITAFAAAQLPESWRRRLEGLGQDLKVSFGGFVRAQLILMLITFFELIVSLILLGVKGAVGVAAITSVIDALPIFGVGIVLIPWAIYSLLVGNFTRGLGLAIS